MKNKVLFVVIFMLAFFLANAQNGNYLKTGLASYYADKFEGRTTSNGEIYYHAKKTAAHRSLPFGSIVKVTNLENNKYVVVRINDRGPFVENRIIDLSKSAAKELDFIAKGIANVKVELIASTNDLPDKTSEDAMNKKNEGYYRLDVHQSSPRGKGVQIGSFREDENVFRLAERLRVKYGEDVFIEIVNMNNQKWYRVILGNASSQSQLEKLKNQLSGEYPDCFIVTFKSSN